MVVFYLFLHEVYDGFVSWNPWKIFSDCLSLLFHQCYGVGEEHYLLIDAMFDEIVVHGKDAHECLATACG